MIQTRLTELLGIRYPAFQGGMAWVAESTLAAAVSNAGGLGLIAGGSAPGEVIREEIRKAKGNPNKNIHAKKKNSNYGGYNGAAEKAHKAAEEKSTLNKLPTWMKVTLIVDIVVIVVLLILRLGVLKNNAPLSYITTLFLGLTCAFLAYMRNYQYKKKSTGYKILQVILMLMAILYIYMGAMGIYTLFR